MSLASQVSALATRIATEFNSVRASTKLYAERAGAAPERFTDWRSRAAGQTLSTSTLSDDGTAFVLTQIGGTPTAATANNRLEVTWPTSSDVALHVQQPLPGKITRIGATFGLGPSANVTSGSIACVTWDTPYAQLGVSQAQCHFFCTAGGWTFQVVQGGTITTVLSGGYVGVLPQDWTELRMEAVLVGATAYLSLPDGSSVSATDSRIASIAGTTADWEFFRDSGTTTVPMALYETWASTRAQPRGQITAGGVAKMLSSYPTTNTVVSYVSSTFAPIASPTLTGTPTVPGYAKIQVPTATKTAAYTAAMNDIVMVDTTSGAITITLPVISAASSGRISVKNLGGTNTVTVAAGAGNTIGSTGAASVPVRYADQVTTFQANGTNWVIPYNHLPPTVVVPVTQRGPIGGVIAPTYAATVTPDATAGVHFRYVATGALAVNVPTGGTDGQRILIEIQASGAARTVTFNGAYEVSAAVPSNVLTVSSGQWGYVAAVNRAGTWRLVSADPVTMSIDGSAITTGTVPVGRMPTNATAASTVAGAADVQVFATVGSFTWTKPAGALSVHVVVIAGGAGGGGGGRAPSGTAYSGGAGGSGGPYGSVVFPASVLGATETVSVGSGGAGGTAATTSSTAGGSGVSGGTSAFGSKLYSYNGILGTGGGSVASVGGAGNAGMAMGGGGASTATGAAGAVGGSPLALGGAAGGGSGAGLAGTQVALAGGAGGTAYLINAVGGTGGAANGSAGGAGGGVATGLPLAGGGGGGGGSRTGGASGAGGAGGLYGGGGGGGATSQNGQVAGTGGQGAQGIVVVTTYF